MKKQKKHSNITIFLTKRNLLFWKWEIFFIYNIMVSLLFLLIPAGGLFAAMIQGDLAAVLIRLDKDLADAIFRDGIFYNFSGYLLFCFYLASFILAAAGGTLFGSHF